MSYRCGSDSSVILSADRRYPDLRDMHRHSTVLFDHRPDEVGFCRAVQEVPKRVVFGPILRWHGTDNILARGLNQCFEQPVLLPRLETVVGLLQVRSLEIFNNLPGGR